MKLVEFPYVVARVDCSYCKRRGAYRLARLAVAFGPDTEIDEVLQQLAANCPWRPQPHERSRNQYMARCHAQFTDIEERTPPDLPPGLGGLRVIEGGKDDVAPETAPSKRRARRRPPSAAE